MDEVQAKRQPVIITKRGKAVAKLGLADDQPDDVFNFLAGKVTIVGDIVGSVIGPEDWKRLR